MKVVSEKNKTISELMEYQTFHPWKKYKKIPYLVEKQVEEGIVWYNLFTREMILLSEKDIKMMESMNIRRIADLVRGWFLIPEEIDAKTLVYSFWQAYYRKHPIKEEQLSLVTILTTTECNARCPYCYEYGTEKNTMTKEIAEQAADYIIRYSSDKILLKWFGGEPLLNPDAIDIISKKIEDSGIEYTSHMITNAYLFDRISDEQIVDVWKLKNVQITIDGARDTYQKIKKLPKDAYDKVMQAVKRLAKLHVKVTIRTHIKKDNLGDLTELIYELSDLKNSTGEEKNYVHVYAAPLFEGIGEEKNILSAEDRKQVYDNYINICELISKTGTGGGNGVPRLKVSHCMADNCHSVVIAPTGDLTPCEHCHDREIIGSIWDEKRFRIPDKWMERTPEVTECSLCFYYPQCLRLNMCDGESACNEEHRRFLNYKAQKSITYAYNQYKKRRSENAKSDRSRKG